MLKFNSLTDAETYCAGITDWEFTDGVTYDDVATTVFKHDICIACALSILDQNPEDYSIICECKSTDRSSYEKLMFQEYIPILSKDHMESLQRAEWEESHYEIDDYLYA